MMQQECCIKIILLKNGNYRFVVRNPSMASVPEYVRSHKQGIPIMQSFQNKGKYEQIKFSFNAATSELNVDISKKKVALKEKKQLADVAEAIYRIWSYTTNQFKQLSLKQFENGNYELESLDAIGIEFSRAFPEYENKRIYFRYSEFQFNNNIAQIELSKSMYPNLAFSFIKGDYYRSPRLSFMEESFKLTEYLDLRCLERCFTLGLTLYSLYMYPRIIEDENIKDKFAKIKSGTYVINNRLSEVELKRKQFNRRVSNHVVLTTAGKLMNLFYISFQTENDIKQDHLITINLLQDKHETDSFKVSLRIAYYDEVMFRCIMYRIQSFIGHQVDYFKTDKKECLLVLNYNDRLFFEYILLHLEISWWKAVDRNSRMVKKDITANSNKNEVTVQHISGNTYELFYGSFYMKFSVSESEVYQFEEIKMENKVDLEKEKMPQSSTRAPTESERISQENRNSSKPVFEYYTGLRTYINSYINLWNLKDITDVTKLYEVCSHLELSTCFKELLNRTILGANIENQKADVYIRVSAKQDVNGMYMVVRKLDQSASIIKHTKVILLPDKENEFKLEVSEKDVRGEGKVNYMKCSTDAYRPDIFF